MILSVFINKTKLTNIKTSILYESRNNTKFWKKTIRIFFLFNHRRDFPNQITQLSARYSF